MSDYTVKIGCSTVINWMYFYPLMVLLKPTVIFDVGKGYASLVQKRTDPGYRRTTIACEKDIGGIPNVNVGVR